MFAATQDTMTSNSATYTHLNDYPLAPATRRYLQEPVLGHLIDGRVTASASGQTMPLVEPASGLEFARVAMGAAADVDLAVQAAKRAYEDGRWWQLHPKERERRLRKLVS